MTAIGIDTHKTTLAACAVDDVGRPIAEATFDNDPRGHDTFVVWARAVAPEATIGIEGSSSFGAPLARAVARRPRRSRGATPPEPRRARADPAARQERSW
jgi:transposase